MDMNCMWNKEPINHWLTEDIYKLLQWIRINNFSSFCKPFWPICSKLFSKFGIISFMTENTQDKTAEI